ncbi:MAG: preprotein translocase subunit SecE [Chloroflexota bacterium]|nr:preprotein translocase subunit SecE [Chloroflexota bacterium]
MAKGKSSKKKAKRENAITRYLRETYAELHKVNWPTRNEAWNLTKVVMIVTVAMAILLGLLDYLFSLELKGIIAQDAVAIGVLVVTIVASVLTIVILNRQAAR